MSTPDFAPWAGSFARQLQKLRATAAPTLHQFELLFALWIPHWRLAQQEEGPHSRLRRWNLRLVFWTFLWQVAQAGASCREAVRQAQVLCRRVGRAAPPDEDSPYCQARGRLPLERLQEIHEDLCAEAHTAVATQDLWCGHQVLVVDGSCITAPDTPANQKAFPQQKVQKPGCGFPIIRLVALLSLATGMLTAWATGTWSQHEIALFQTLWEQLRPGDVLLADRGFCNWGLLAQCLQRNVHAVFRVKGVRRRDFRQGQRLSRHQRRQVDFRKARRLGHNDGLFVWTKGCQPSKILSATQWALLPAQITVRILRFTATIRGFRSRRITLVTTLLDPELFPARDLVGLYARRWRLELCLRDLKTTMGMEHLRCKTPDMVEKELLAYLVAHNAVRCVMAEALARYTVDLERISFKGSLDALRQYSDAIGKARNRKIRRQLWEDLLLNLARDLVRYRPHRTEPRAVKRRPKSYPLLNQPRRRFKDVPHRNRYWKGHPRELPKPYLRAIRVRSILLTDGDVDDGASGGSVSMPRWA